MRKSTLKEVVDTMQASFKNHIDEVTSQGIRVVSIAVVLDPMGNPIMACDSFPPDVTPARALNALANYHNKLVEVDRIRQAAMTVN